MVKDQLEKLVELQNIDDEIRKLKEEISYLPEKLKEWERVLKQKSSKLDEIKKEHTKIKLLRREKEGALLEIENQIQKLQKSLTEVKTNKEYNSILTEITNLKNKISQDEEEVIIIMEKDDELARKEKEFLSILEEEKKSIEMKKKEEEEKIEKLKGILKTKESERDKKTNEIDKAILNLYEKIKKSKKDGIAICRLHQEPGKESCSGCFVFVPTYLVEKVKKKNEIVQCENCSRILY